ncbi:MAG: hypothetical protein AAF488_10810, partial [Planctomycetota bacterium]
MKPVRPVYIVGGAHTPFIGKFHPDFIWKKHPDFGKRDNPDIEHYLTDEQGVARSPVALVRSVRVHATDAARHLAHAVEGAAGEE